MPKKFDPSGKTLPGATMAIVFTLSGTGAELADALSGDGVIPMPVAGKSTPIPRNLQFGAVVAGMSYQDQLSILYTPNSDFGIIAGRH
jgi:hypothetical protein